MKELLGRPGSVSGLLLRVSQFSCAGIAIAVMVTTDRFAEFTCFCYLVSSMALQVLWSLGLACLDIYALSKKRDLQNKLLVRLFVVGDWVTATLSLAAASSSSGIAILFVRDFHFCTVPLYKGPRIQRDGWITEVWLNNHLETTRAS
nr:CASP-like protein 5B2 isoform X3 [Malus domestica]XP_028957045.1 CASP-like protein 5B2 isoform X3 [Malus domestica]